MNDLQRELSARLTWPGLHGATASGLDTVLRVNGVRVILYPSGKIDILTVDDSDYARECEAKIRAEFGDLILGHVKTFRLVSRDDHEGLRAELAREAEEEDAAVAVPRPEIPVRTRVRGELWSVRTAGHDGPPITSAEGRFMAWDAEGDAAVQLDDGEVTYLLGATVEVIA